MSPKPIPTSAFKKTQVALWAEIDEELYYRIFSGAGAAEKNELEKLGKRIDEAVDEDTKDFLCDQAADINYYTDQLKLWAGYLSIIALYSKVEIARARMLTIATGAKDNYHNISTVDRTLLAKPLNIVHSAIRDQVKVDELRVVNNNIKHNGSKIDDRLAVFPGYKIGDEIVIDYPKWKYFFDACESYLKDLSVQLRTRMP